MKFWMYSILLALLLMLLKSVEVVAAPLVDCAKHKKDDLTALACNVYWESRNQSAKGMLAIAAATMWRVADADYPNTIAKVVWQKNWVKRDQQFYPQFSWTMDGKRDKPLKVEQEQWDHAWQIARKFAVSTLRKSLICPAWSATNKTWDALEEQGVRVTRRPIMCKAYEILMLAKFAFLDTIDPIDGAVMFHADYVDPAWRHDYTLVAQIDTHLFYKKSK
jgi:hypothetical protein